MDFDEYKILGVSMHSTSNEIRRAYKRKCLEFHPDKNNENPENFVEVCRAYNKLKNMDSPSQLINQPDPLARIFQLRI